MVEFHFHFIWNHTGLQVDYTQVKQRAACAELTQVYKVFAACLVKDYVAYVKVTVQRSVGIGQCADKSYQTVSLIIGQVRILFNVLYILVLCFREQSGRGCGGVQFLAVSCRARQTPEHTDP